MFPSRFAYRRAETFEEAVAVLSEHGEDARPLAGGQSLIPLMKLRVVHPGMVVDINRVPGLDAIALDGDSLTMGSLVRHAQVHAHREIRERVPMVFEAVRTLGDAQVRNLGTIGGAAAEADPGGDWGPVFLALGGEVTCRGPAGRRVVATDGFFVDYLTSDLQPDELIEQVRLHVPNGSSGSAYRKLERRVGDFAVVAVAATVTLDDDGSCSDVGIGLGGVGLTPVKPREVEDALRGGALGARELDEAAGLLDEMISPLDDGRAPAAYKRSVARTLLVRTLEDAAARARDRVEVRP